MGRASAAQPTRVVDPSNLHVPVAQGGDTVLREVRPMLRPLLPARAPYAACGRSGFVTCVRGPEREEHVHKSFSSTPAQCEGGASKSHALGSA